MDWLQIAATVGGLLLSLSPWFVWVTRSIFTLQSDIRSNTEKDQAVSDMIKEINGKMDKMSEQLGHIELALAENKIRIK